MSMNVFEWYNIIFLAPAFLSLVYIAISVFTGLGSDIDGDLHGDIHVDVDHDIHIDHDVHVDHDHDLGHDTDHESGNVSIAEGILGILNLKNRCPKTFAFAMLFLIWGACGYIFNSIIARNFHPIWMVLLPANIFLSAFISVFSVRKIAPLIAKSMPSDQSSPTSEIYEGSRAHVSTLLTKEKGGMVCIDRSGTMLKKYAVLEPAYTGPDLKRDEEVLITKYDKGKDIFVVSPLNQVM